VGIDGNDRMQESQVTTGIDDVEMLLKVRASAEYDGLIK
jgi:hypothetical protein